VRPISPWRDDRTWQRRLARDRALLLQRLDEPQLAFVRGMVGVADGGGALDFLLVYGSAARGEAREDSDVDVYFEAGDLPEPFNREDPNGFFHAFGVPRGSLLGAVRHGDAASFEIARDAIVVADTERFRQVLIVIDEERLEAAAGDHR
jgi:predicted nucleotidyltransferase